MTDLETLAVPHVEDDVRLSRPEAAASGSRTAVARGRVLVGEEVVERIRKSAIGKGDVLAVSQVAGLLGAKHASRLIPHCHDVLLSGVDLDLELNEAEHAVEIRAYVKASGPTGVEMEALTAVSVAALTVYDMVKSVSRDVTITDIQLLAKTGGQSGDYRRAD